MNELICARMGTDKFGSAKVMLFGQLIANNTKKTDFRPIFTTQNQPLV